MLVRSDFRPNDSCINQLISITHNIYRAFDANPSLEVRGVFLDLSKAFDKVWHEGLLYKLKSNGINGNALQLIKSFLHKRCQRIVLKGQSQSSSWLSTRADVPQGSVLGPLFFLIYINDLPEGLNSEVKLFADDTSLFNIVNCINTSASTLNSDLLKIMDWPYQRKMSFNADRTKQAQKIFSPERETQLHIHHSFSTILKLSLVQIRRICIVSFPPFGREGSERFSMLAIKGGLALFEFLQGRVSKKGRVDFFRGWGPEDFLKVIFNC